MENLAWYPGQPDGQGFQKCTSFLAKNGTIGDDGCSVEYCFACSWINEPLFHLRGLCKNSEIASQYVLLPYSTYDDMFFFLGLGPTNILYSKEKNSWLIVKDVMFDLIAPNGTTTKPKNILGSFQPDDISNKMPIGKKFWNLKDQECKGIRPLKLTGVSTYWFFILQSRGKTLD